jgi:methylmalonyl-CoA mutase cobalamin-binding subunit
MLVATPYGELHEVGALAACRLAQSHGFDPLYVGAQLPVYEIARLARHNAIRIIVMGGSSASSDLPMQQLRQLAEIVEAGTIIFTGGSAYETVADQRDVAIRHCRSMRHFCCQMEIMAALAQSLIAVE